MIKKSSIGVRYETDERNALNKALIAEDRSISALIRHITVRWLIENGYLKRKRL